MTTQTSLSPLQPVIEQLEKSRNPSQQRIARDLSVLRSLSEGIWSGRVLIGGVRLTADRSLCVAVEMNVPGLIWDGRPRRYNGGFSAALILPRSYPLVMAQVRFLSPVPFCPHILHSESGVDERGLPRELLGFLEAIRRDEEGWCCYARSSDWSPLATHDLALCLWQTSSLVAGSLYWGERATLNNQALAEYSRLSEQRELPLGDPLPFHGLATTIEELDNDDAIEIEEIEG